MRIADEASDTEAQAARDAAAKLQEVVREADNEAEAGDKSPREALESLGRELAFRPVVGPLVLAITQIALWAACRSDDVLGAFVDRCRVVPGAGRLIWNCVVRLALHLGGGRRKSLGDAVVWEGGGRLGGHGRGRRGRRTRS